MHVNLQRYRHVEENAYIYIYIKKKKKRTTINHNMALT